MMSAKIYMSLLLLNKEKDSVVPIDSIIEYLHAKRNKTMKFIALQYYDSSGKGFLTPEVSCTRYYFESMSISSSQLFSELIRLKAIEGFIAIMNLGLSAKKKKKNFEPTTTDG